MATKEEILDIKFNVEVWSYYHLEFILKSIKKVMKDYKGIEESLYKYEEMIKNEQDNMVILLDASDYDLLESMRCEIRLLFIYYLKMLRTALNINKDLYVKYERPLYLGTIENTEMMYNRVNTYLTRVIYNKYSTYKICRYIKYNILKEFYEINKQFYN